MGITEVTVPKQYVLVQNNEPTGAFSGQIWYKPDTANTYIYQANGWKLITIDPSGEFSFIENEIATHELNIIELRAITESTPIDSDTLLSDTFNTANGLKNSLDDTDALFQTNKYARVPNELGKNLIAYYNFEEASGTIEDQKGTLNSNAVTGATYEQTGIVDKCLTLANGYIGFPETDGNWGIATQTNAFSWSVWIKIPTEIDSGYWTIISSRTLNVKQGLNYEYNSGTRRLNWAREKRNVGTQSTMHTINLGDNNWHNLICVFNNSTGKIYIDGEEVASDIMSGEGTGSWGRYNNLGNSTYNGLIDEFAVFDKALTADEISLIYGNGQGRKYNSANYAEEKEDLTQEINLELPTISGEVSHTQLIINGEIETGASITYKLNNGTTDSAEVNLNTKNAYTLTGNPTKLKIYLNPKETEATEGNPNIKTYCLKIWKSGGE